MGDADTERLDLIARLSGLPEVTEAVQECEEIRTGISDTRGDLLRIAHELPLLIDARDEDDDFELDSTSEQDEKPTIH